MPMKIAKWLILLGLLLPSLIIQAQEASLAATVTVIIDGVFLQRADTEQQLPLPVGAIAPIGAGDTITTDGTGRAFIDFNDASRVLLLPNSRYELSLFATDEDDSLVVQASADGVLIQQSDPNVTFSDFQLVTDDFTVTTSSQLFAVWAVEDRLEGVVNADGELIVDDAIADISTSVPVGSGLMPQFDTVPVSLDAPWHAAQLFGLSFNCVGTVSTNGSLGLRVRGGAALDYPIVDVVQDGDLALIVGITENGNWYRIIYQTGFGWQFSDLITRDDCRPLQTFPNLIREQNEIIRDVTEAELEFLVPFFGTPESNTTFYQ